MNPLLKVALQYWFRLVIWNFLIFFYYYIQSYQHLIFINILITIYFIHYIFNILLLYLSLIVISFFMNIIHVRLYCSKFNFGAMIIAWEDQSGVCKWNNFNFAYYECISNIKKNIILASTHTCCYYGENNYEKAWD